MIGKLALIFGGKIFLVWRHRSQGFSLLLHTANQVLVPETEV